MKIVFISGICLHKCHENFTITTFSFSKVLFGISILEEIPEIGSQSTRFLLSLLLTFRIWMRPIFLGSEYITQIIKNHSQSQFPETVL